MFVHPRCATTSLLAALLSGITLSTNACELRMVPSEANHGTCHILVGYYQGKRVGPFHVGYSDGTRVIAGDCNGFVHVLKVDANDVTVQPFGQWSGETIRLSDDCKSGEKIR